MLGAEAIPAVPRDLIIERRQVAFADERAQRDGLLIPRLFLALVLAAFSVLVPGEADRFLESPLTWSQLFPAR